MIKLDSRMHRQPSILSQEVSGTVVLLNPDNGHYYSLEDVGIRAWELCDGNHTVKEIAVSIGKEFEASVEQIETDLLDLFRELTHEQLVAASPEASRPGSERTHAG